MSAPQVPAEIPSPNDLRVYESGDISEHPGSTPPYNTEVYKTHEDYVEIADAAYDLAREQEKLHGLTRETGALYWDAAQRRIDATWMAPESHLKKLSPIDTLRVAGSLAIAVETGAVPDYREPQYDETGQLIDRRENVQRIYSEMMVEAGRQVGSEDGQVELVLDGEDESVKPSEVMSSAIHEGGKAAGDEESATELEEQITQDHLTIEEMETAEIPIVTPAFAAAVTRIAVKELSGARRIPVAA